MWTERGGALLAVLWLTAGLSAIAFGVASTVKNETQRATNAVEETRAYFLATGAIERAMLYMRWGPQHVLPNGAPRYYAPGMPRLYFRFPSGDAEVEVIPETARMNVNVAPRQELTMLLLALGAAPAQADLIAAAIEDWRTPAPGGFSPFDAFYLARTPSFRARHASLEETEELLVVQGMTPELFYGSYARDANGRLIATGGLRDCVSVYGNNAQFDVNWAHPAVLQAAGVAPAVAAAIVARRTQSPIVPDELPMWIQAAGPAGSRLRLGGGSIYTLRASARLRLPGGALSDLRRSVAAQVKLMPAGYDKPMHVLRWYDNAWRP
jgi:general secretion pathway protein K